MVSVVKLFSTRRAGAAAIALVVAATAATVLAVLPSFSWPKVTPRLAVVGGRLEASAVVRGGHYGHTLEVGRWLYRSYTGRLKSGETCASVLPPSPNTTTSTLSGVDLHVRRFSSGRAPIRLGSAAAAPGCWRLTVAVTTPGYARSHPGRWRTFSSTALIK